MLVWFRREAWVIERFEPRSELSGSLYPIIDEVTNSMPDGRRAIGPFGDVEPFSNRAASPFGSVVYDRKLGKVIYWFPNVQMSSHVFVPRSDDAFEVEAALYETSSLDRKISSIKYGLVYYRRRFPEWWWGHFYRPEVWALIGLTLIIAWRGVRRFQQLRATP